MIRGCDDEDEAAALSVMLKETRDYSAYFVKKMNGEEPRTSLCDLRDQGKALSFTDLVEVCKYQRARYSTMRRYHGQPNLSRRTKKILKGMVHQEAEKAAIISTLLKFPMRTTEAEKAKVKWTGKNTMRIQVAASARKGNMYPIDARLSQ